MITDPQRHLAARGERGLTLIELMVAMVISGIVVGFSLHIHTKMTAGYRSQGRLAEVQQNLRDARRMLLGDIRLAGYKVPGQGMSLPDGSMRLAFRVTNNIDGSGRDGPDSYDVYYGDADSAQAVVAVAETSVSVGSTPLVNVGDLLLLTTGAEACVVEATGLGAADIQFAPQANTYNTNANNSHCDGVETAVGSGGAAQVMRLIARSYRIDPTRRQASYLQRSDTGQLTTDPAQWQDLGLGFTNLQLAVRFFQNGDTVDEDGDGDPTRDWYSGDNMENPTVGWIPTDVSLSIEVRGQYEADVETPATPAYIDLSAINNNRVGDFGQACPSNPVVDPCGVDLRNLDDASRPERYRGRHIYRSSTTMIDLRNLGIGIE